MNPGQETPARPRRVGVLIAVAATALAADVISKAIVVATLQDRAPVRLLGGLLTLRVIRNSGAAFNGAVYNSGNSMTLIFTVIAVAVVVAILRYARRLRSAPWAITLGLLLGGALGNLSDRLLRSPGPLRGHVVDWIELPHWPVFNLADSAIVCGGVLAVLLASRGLQMDGTVHRGGAAPGASDGDPEAGAGTTGGPGDGADGRSGGGAESRSGDGTDARSGGGGEDRSADGAEARPGDRVAARPQETATAGSDEAAEPPSGADR